MALEQEKAFIWRDKLTQHIPFRISWFLTNRSFSLYSGVCLLENNGQRQLGIKFYNQRPLSEKVKSLIRKSFPKEMPHDIPILYEETGSVEAASK